MDLSRSRRLVATDYLAFLDRFSIRFLRALTLLPSGRSERRARCFWCSRVSTVIRSLISDKPETCRLFYLTNWSSSLIMLFAASSSFSLCSTTLMMGASRYGNLSGLWLYSILPNSKVLSDYKSHDWTITLACSETSGEVVRYRIISAIARYLPGCVLFYPLAI